jgi:aminoglycoside phosphotransferase (APT) family kinase protein
MTEIRLGAVHALDEEAFRRWCAENLPALGDVHSFRLLTGGQSNITISFESAAGPMVLRRPPLGHVMQSAHDMRREYRVLQALKDTTVPTPVPICHAPEATGGVDAEFYIMTREEGFALTDAGADARLSDTDRAQLSRSLATTLADIHAVGTDHPALSELGRPAGFRERQVRRWTRQLEASRSRDLPATEELGRRLAENSPHTPGHVGLVHGDYKFNNTLVLPGSEDVPARITAVLDWEMAALGDPLTDLAVLGIYWDMPSYGEATAAHFETAVRPGAGYPAFDELVEHYTRRAEEHGRTDAVAGLHWYLALAAFKIAVIVESLHYRYSHGMAIGEDSKHAGAMTEPLARVGLKHLRRSHGLYA